MAGKPEVTVIIPVYNAAEYLTQCIESVCKQSFQDIEILCIDDASTDASAEKLYELQKKDARIQVVRNETNFGAGPTRNRGIALAEGKYFLFLDADDFIAEDMVGKLYHRAEENQLELCFFLHATYDHAAKRPIFNVPTSGLFLYQYRHRVFSWEEVQEFFYQSVFCVPWNRLYLTTFVQNSVIRFPSLENSEDLFFGNALVTQAKRMGTVCNSHPYLYYRVNRGGQVSDSVSASPESMLNAIARLYRFLRRTGKLEGAVRSYHTSVVALLNFVVSASLQPPKALSYINDNQACIGMAGLGEQDFLNREAWYMYRNFCQYHIFSSDDVYVRMLENDLSRKQQLQDWFMNNGRRKTAVWGLGAKSRFMISYFKKWGILVDCVIDRKGDKRADMSVDDRVYLPEEAGHVDDVFLTISSILPAVVQKCEQLKWHCRIIDLDMFYTLDRDLEECVIIV